MRIGDLGEKSTFLAWGLTSLKRQTWKSNCNRSPPELLFGLGLILFLREGFLLSPTYLLAEDDPELLALLPPFLGAGTVCMHKHSLAQNLSLPHTLPGSAAPATGRLFLLASKSKARCWPKVPIL